jgi:tetratricopeptide (TPR) repeat protein
MQKYVRILKMTSHTFKIFLPLALFISIVFNIHANSLNNSNIIIGDSLFAKKDYIKCLVYYKNAFEKDKAFSQQMLARMAMIEEANEQYVMALYYLNVMYTYYPDGRVIQKMEDMGNQYNLIGYGYTDLQYVISIYKEYYYYIIFSISAIGFPFIVYLYFRKRKAIRLGIRPLLFLILLGAAFYLNNYDITPMMGIINNDCLIMEGPSPGATEIERVDAGHRVRIIKKEGIWYEISWKDKQAYIRDVYLLPIEN